MIFRSVEIAPGKACVTAPNDARHLRLCLLTSRDDTTINDSECVMDKYYRIYHDTTK
jgi:hypothetical protein